MFITPKSVSMLYLVSYSISNTAPLEASVKQRVSAALPRLSLGAKMLAIYFTRFIYSQFVTKKFAY